tara:strand:+ start:824 stop:1003 length:180 start_codon:yes stop_codon:yes gene_type:complete
MKINIKGIDVEVRYRENWYDSTVLFFTDPGDTKREILQYLFDEGFINDRRTPYKILELR